VEAVGPAVGTGDTAQAGDRLGAKLGQQGSTVGSHCFRLKRHGGTGGKGAIGGIGLDSMKVRNDALAQASKFVFEVDVGFVETVSVRREADEQLPHGDADLSAPEWEFAAVSFAAELESEGLAGLTAGEGGEHGIESGTIVSKGGDNFIEFFEGFINAAGDFFGDARFDGGGCELADGGGNKVRDGKGVFGFGDLEDLPAYVVMEIESLLEVDRTANVAWDVGDDSGECVS
jgi:hypothetical protein